MSGYPGPLKGLRVIEFAGIGPAPFAARLLAQLGAEVLRIDRPAVGGDQLLPIPAEFDFLNLGKASVELDLKQPGDVARALDLVAGADVLVEGFRPGVMERQGLSPEMCHARNPALIYGRVTGWGQDGPMAQEAGHDITYIALSGALAAIGEAGGPPVPPLNLLGDFAGGSLYLVIGILAALDQVRRGGAGQVVDAAMLDGATHLMSFVYGLRQAGIWKNQRGSNQPDGGFPFNAVYQTRDGKWLAVAAAEMKFRLNLLRELGLSEEIAKQADRRSGWAPIKAQLAAVFAGDTRDAWAARLAGKDCCTVPVLDLDEAPQHPQVQARDLFAPQHAGGPLVPRVAPRFSDGAPVTAACDPQDILARWTLGRRP